MGGEGASSTSALYQVVVVRFEKTRLVVVLEMLDQAAPPVVEDCQRTTLPVCPLKVSRPLFVPEHTVVLPPTEPPMDCPKEFLNTINVIKKANTFFIARFI